MSQPTVSNIPIEDLTPEQRAMLTPYEIGAALNALFALYAELEAESIEAEKALAVAEINALFQPDPATKAAVRTAKRDVKVLQIRLRAAAARKSILQSLAKQLPG